MEAFAPFYVERYAAVALQAKILSVFYDNLDASDPNDPNVIIKIDISNAFNTTDRAVTLDMISGRDSQD
jgi:hypothetical protein